MGYPVVSPTQIQYDKGEGIVAGVNQGIANYFKAGEQARQNRLADIQAQNADLQGKVMQFNLDKAAREMEDEKKFDEIAASVPMDKDVEKTVIRGDDYSGPIEEKVIEKAPIRMSDYYGAIAQKAQAAGLSKHAVQANSMAIAHRKEEMSEAVNMYKTWFDMAKGNPEVLKAVRQAWRKDERFKGSPLQDMEVDFDTGTITYPVKVTKGNPILMYDGSQMDVDGEYDVTMINTPQGPRAITVKDKKSGLKFQNNIPVGGDQVEAGFIDEGTGAYQPLMIDGKRARGQRWKQGTAGAGGAGGDPFKGDPGKHARYRNSVEMQIQRELTMKYGKEVYDPLSGKFISPSPGVTREMLASEAEEMRQDIYASDNYKPINKKEGKTEAKPAGKKMVLDALPKIGEKASNPEGSKIKDDKGNVVRVVKNGKWVNP